MRRPTRPYNFNLVASKISLGLVSGVGAIIRISIAALVASLLIPLGAHGAAATPDVPPAVVPIMSAFENAQRMLSRDVGLSVALPDGHALWIYGDTGVWLKNGIGEWHQKEFIPGSTAMLVKTVRGEVPKGGELPSGTPTHFLPNPHNLHLPDHSGRPCVYPKAAFATRWPTGAALLPGNAAQVLVTYASVCVTTPTKDKVNVSAQAWGFMVYNWRTKRFDKGPVDVFGPSRDGSAIPPEQVYGQPIFDGGMLTLYSSRCTVYFVQCSAGRVRAITVAGGVASLNKTSTYQVTQLATDGTDLWLPMAVSVGRYSTGYRLLETTSIAGAYRIFSSATPSGPWHLTRSGTLPGCPTKKAFCFALEGHPELSTPDTIFVSYKNPDVGPGGHIVISAIPG